MEPVVDKLKGFFKSTEDFTKGLFHKPHKPNYYNPIEILKRLQREAFTDIMKLRDRQEKVEKILSFYKSTPFQEPNTHVRGIVDVGGALLLLDSVDEYRCDAINRAGMRTGVNSRFSFETSVREKDVLVAEFQACRAEEGLFDDVGWSSLSLAKVMYSANVNDWFSAVAAPCGARCRDVAVASNSLPQEQSMTNFSSLRPPLLGQNLGAAVGMMVKKANMAAALAEFVSGLEMQSDSLATRSCFSTFGQIIYQLSKGTNLTLFGLHKRLGATSQQTSLPKFTIPFGNLRLRKVCDQSEDTPASPISDGGDKTMDGSIALMLESELDESTRIGGWIEMQNSSPKCLQWAVTMSDTPDDELGWGLSLGGITQGPSTWDHFQVEAFLRFNVGKKCSLHPGLVYVMDGTTRIPAIMFRSSWTL